MRVSLKSIPGVENVDVSLSKGLAVATFAAGNTVQYSQLLRAIEKNGFVIKGAELVADGTVVPTASGFDLQVSGSSERLKLVPEQANSPSVAPFAGKNVEVTGSIGEVPKSKNPDALRYSSITEK